MASIPSTQKQWTVTGTGKAFETLTLDPSAAVPVAGAHEVLVRMRAASLNFRDLIIPRGKYPFATKFPVVAASDGAGEVVGIGEKVTRWQVGDRVAVLFHQEHLYGPVTPEAAGTGVGGVVDGTLRQYAVFNEAGLVRAPKNLSWAEASTLTCAGVTSWNALYGLRALRPGETVLVQGTGGVSLFALQFAKAAGATVIATTSTKDKEELLKKLGADHVLNYKEDENWGETAKKLTGGAGVDHVIEVGGAATLGQTLKAIKFEGIISIIGFLGGVNAPEASLIQCLSHVCTARGVYVGSRQQMEEMVTAMEVNDIHPVVDPKVFTLEQTKEAYEYQVS
ncbi:hypothetical protein F4777DRAFT_335360 [Nemania sp. FL0916]|nr:hypothetical protein F4777DRAFT_335360 [Nemania sp. FL0916]